MMASEQLKLFAECLYDPQDVVEVRMLRIEPRDAISRWTKAYDLSKWAKTSMNQSYDIYCGANPRIKTGGTFNKDVAIARCVWVDWDNTSLVEAASRTDNAQLPVPTCVIWSGGGVHAYWRLSQRMEDMLLWRKLQKQMILLLGSDKSIHDPARIMRMPGFFNHKPGRTESRLIHANPKHRVRAADLAERCPKIEEPVTDYQSHYQMPTERMFLIKRAAAYLQRIPAAIAGNHGHNATFRAAAILCRFGLSEDEAMPILFDYNQRCDPPWSEKDLVRKYREARKQAHLTRSPRI